MQSYKQTALDAVIQTDYLLIEASHQRLLCSFWSCPTDSNLRYITITRMQIFLQMSHWSNNNFWCPQAVVWSEALTLDTFPWRGTKCVCMCVYVLGKGEGARTKGICLVLTYWLKDCSSDFCSYGRNMLTSDLLTEEPKLWFLCIWKASA